MTSTKQRSLPIQCKSHRGYHQFETSTSSSGYSTKAEYDLKTWLMYNRIVQARLKSTATDGLSSISQIQDFEIDGSDILTSVEDSLQETSESKIYDGEIFDLDL